MRAGKVSFPFSLPAAIAAATACSISDCERTPTVFKNLRMLMLKTSSFMPVLLGADQKIRRKARQVSTAAIGLVERDEPRGRRIVSARRRLRVHVRQDARRQALA